MSTPSDSATRTWFAVVRAYLGCERQFARLLAHFELTPAQFEALSVIERKAGSATPAELAEALMVTRGNVSGLVRRLQERGLLAVEQHPDDARSVRCVLTDEAHSRLIPARRAARLFIEEQMAPFDAAERAATEAQMSRMSAHLAAMDPDAIAALARASHHADAQPRVRHVTR